MTLYAICLANRSAALFHLKEFYYCIKDIDEALEHHYPRVSIVIIVFIGRESCSVAGVKSGEISPAPIFVVSDRLANWVLRFRSLVLFRDSDWSRSNRGRG